METSTGVRGLRVLLLSLCMVVPMSAHAQQVPPPGTKYVTPFCGTIYAATTGMRNHGVVVGEPYLGSIDFTQRDPDFVDAHSNSTEWDCTQGAEFECGIWSARLGEFTPPQVTEPTDIFGPIAGIDQTTQTYRLTADLDDFVTGPGIYSATGVVEFEILCPDCGDVNNRFSIKPDFEDNIANISGDVVVNLAVPGIGGSLSGPEGNPQDVRMSITRLGGACNQFVPASSSWGLVSLVGLMVVTSLFFAGRKATSES